MLVLAGQLYMPAAVLAVTLTSSTLGALWPVAWIKIIARAPAAYAYFALVWIGSLMLGIVLVIALALQLPRTAIGYFSEGLVWCMFWFAQAVLVGNFIRENAQAFGWDAPAVSPPPIPTSAPAARPRATTPPPVSGVRFATASAEVTRAGVDAHREDGSTVLVLWRDVVGIIARRLPPDSGGAPFLDLISTSGSTLRFLPWTRLSGEPIAGEGEERIRALVAIVNTHVPNLHVDRVTRAYLDSRGPPTQLPDAAALAEHDRHVT
jgi:hypothetical protein